MNILAIDTLSSTLSVAAQGPHGFATQSFAGSGPSHAERLIPLIDAVVFAAGFTASATDMVLAPDGPGSFTGLRLGFAAAKALQLSSKSCFLSIPTLPCIASLYETWSGALAVVIDAKRERFYAQLFKNGCAITEVFDKTAAEILSFFAENEQWLVTGYGTDVFKRDIAALSYALPIHFIEASSLSFAPAMVRYAQTHSTELENAADYAGPQYIRKSDAEKN